MSCFITGIVEFSLTNLISDSPPLGTIKSTYLSSLISFATPSLVESGSNEIACSGSLFFARTSLKTTAIALFECSASFPPFRTQTFPLLKHKAAVSLVTFGRLS